MLRRLALGLTSLTFAVSAAAQSSNAFLTPPMLAPSSGTVYAGTAAVDLNGDGKLDLLFVDGTVLLSKADGTYQTGTPWCTTAQSYCSQPGLPTMVVVADFNQDGKADVVAATPNFVFVLLGNGDGTFQPAVSSVSGSTSTVLAVADVNGDGNPDVLLIGPTAGPVPILLGKGDGTFQTAIAGPSVGNVFVAAVDVNGDHKVDIIAKAISTSVSPQIDVYTGNGDGTFSNTAIVTSTTIPPNDGSSFDVRVADMDGDGKIDVVISQFPQTSYLSIFNTAPITPIDPLQTPQGTYVLFGKGDATFGAATNISPRGGVTSIGDLNNDGLPDLILVGSFVDVLTGTGGGNVALTASYFPGFVTTRGIIGDFNGDGKADVFVGESLLFGSGDGTLKANVVSYFSTVGPAAVDDFNKDGKADLAVPGTDGTIQILNGDGTGLFTPGFASPVIRTSQDVVALQSADLNGDGKADLVVATSLSSSPSWTVFDFLGNGDGTFNAPVTVGQSSQLALVSMGVADLNNDHKQDLIVSDSSGGINVYLGNGDGTFAAANTFFGGVLTGVAFVTGDFNGDGKIDLVITANNGLSFLAGKGDGTFATAVTATSAIFGVTAVGDFNGDGILDLCNGNVVVLGNGDGTFKTGSTIPIGQAPINYTVATDLNGDGKIDLVGRSPRQSVGSINYALGKGDGTFTPTIIYPQYSDENFFSSPIVGDVNGDGRPDILFIYQHGVVSVLNTQPPAASDFVPTVTSPTSSTVSAGQSATFGFTVGASGGFAQTVNFTCSGAPAKSTCTVSPTSAMVSGTTAIPIKVTVTTTAGTSNLPVSFYQPPTSRQLMFIPLGILASLVIVLAALTMRGGSGRKRTFARFAWAPAACGLAIVATSLLLVACGGGSSPSGSQPPPPTSGTATGSYPIKVTGASGSGSSAVSHTVTFTLVVK